MFKAPKPRRKIAAARLKAIHAQEFHEASEARALKVTSDLEDMGPEALSGRHDAGHRRAIGAWPKVRKHLDGTALTTRHVSLKTAGDLP